jgi:hypothetical protein
MGRPRGRRGELREKLEGSNGAILFEGDSKIDGAPVMVVATGIIKSGAFNTKIGNVIQLWILRQDVEPTDAMKSGDDVSICGDCKFRPQNNGNGRRNRACYVNIGMPTKIFDAWLRERYFDATNRRDLWPDFFRDRIVRVGAYGDPVAVAHPIWEEMLESARGWIGYTHAWRFAPARFKNFVMASVDSPEEREEAKQSRWPWRTFRSRFEHEPILPDEIECPAQPRIYKPKAKARVMAGLTPKDSPTCEGCRLCNGIRYFPDLRKDLSVVVHGWAHSVAAYPVARELGSLPLVTDHFH